MCPGGDKDHPGKWKVSNRLQWTVFCGSCDVSIIFFLHLEITKISCPTIMGLCMFVFCVCVHMYKRDIQVCMWTLKINFVDMTFSIIFEAATWIKLRLPCLWGVCHFQHNYLTGLCLLGL